MNYRSVGSFMGRILLAMDVFMVPALLISIYYGENVAVAAFMASMMGIAVLGGSLCAMGRGEAKGFYAKEGFVCVGLSWIVLGLVGAMPFRLSGAIPNYLDAVFETVSGFTTTGASILNNVEALPFGLLYWRSFTHWVGGMGVLVFLLAVSLGNDKSRGYTVHILRAESPGPSVSKLVPKIRQSAAILYFIYIILTVLCFLFLLLGDMPLFDAVCTAFGTAGTGGFGIKNDSMASYSLFARNVVTVFMILFGINFSVYYYIALRKYKAIIKDEELKLYLGIILASILLILYNTRGMFESVGEAVSHVAFQVGTIITTTGFATVDFDRWPEFSKSVLLVLMFIGACAGSTGGGFKVSRVIILIKNLFKSMRQLVHPGKVEAVRINDTVIDEKTLGNTNTFLAAYVMIFLISCFIISLDGLSFTTNFSAVTACINNIGPGFERVGPAFNYACFGAVSKIVLIMDMLIGRLEIFPILILFSKSTWK